MNRVLREFLVALCAWVNLLPGAGRPPTCAGRHGLLDLAATAALRLTLWTKPPDYRICRVWGCISGQAGPNRRPIVQGMTMMAPGQAG